MPTNTQDEGREVINTPGRDKLWQWFGLSYASWLTIPRVLMHEMSDDWQERMTQLLNEYDAAFPNQPDIGTRVQVTQDGKLIKTPEWILSYRHPDRKLIAALAESEREVGGE